MFITRPAGVPFVAWYQSNSCSGAGQRSFLSPCFVHSASVCGLAGGGRGRSAQVLPYCAFRLVFLYLSSARVAECAGPALQHGGLASRGWNFNLLFPFCCHLCVLHHLVKPKFNEMLAGATNLDLKKVLHCVDGKGRTAIWLGRRGGRGGRLPHECVCPRAEHTLSVPHWGCCFATCLLWHF